MMFSLDILARELVTSGHRLTECVKQRDYDEIKELVNDIDNRRAKVSISY